MKWHETSIPGLPYDYNAGPSRVLSGVYEGKHALEDLLELHPSVNCLTAVYLLAMMSLGVRLPIHFDTVNLILDQTHVRNLETDELLRPGDLVFVAKPGIEQFREIPEAIKHERTMVREFIKQFPGPHVMWWSGNYFIHASYYANRQVVASTPEELSLYPNYSTLYARKRIVR